MQKSSIEIIGGQEQDRDYEWGQSQNQRHYLGQGQGSWKPFKKRKTTRRHQKLERTSSNLDTMQPAEEQHQEKKNILSQYRFCFIKNHMHRHAF